MAIDRDAIRRAVAILSPEERRGLVTVAAVGLAAAIGAAAMVGSVLPFLAVLAAPGNIATDPFLAGLYDGLGFTAPGRFLVFLGWMAILVVLVAIALQVARELAANRFAARLTHSLGLRLFRRYLDQSYAFYASRHTSDLSAAILSEAEEVVRGFYRPATELFVSAATTLAVLLVLAWVNPLVTLWALLLIGGAYGGSYLLIRRRTRRLGLARAAANRARYQMVQDGLQGIKEIKLLGREGAFLDRFETRSDEIRAATVAVRVLSNVPRHIIQGILFAGIVLFCLVLIPEGGLGEGGGALAEIVPILGLYAFAGQRLMPEIQRFYSAIAALRYGTGAVDRIHADLSALDETPEPASPSAVAAEMAFGPGRPLRLDHVSFSYPGAARPSLDRVSLEIGAGEKLGVIGASGAGKTTLGDIILGLLLPGEGTLRVGARAIDASTVRAWRRNVGYVPQSIFLADASVAENIAFGLDAGEIDGARVREVARVAQIDRFVETLPQGYDTRIGERGIRLSGGQRQRIGIARALYRDAPLIVFDEATSALDSLTEAEFLSALAALPDDKTVVIIAHRLTTLEICDRIVLMEEGRIAGTGSRAEFADRQGPFRTVA